MSFAVELQPPGRLLLPAIRLARQRSRRAAGQCVNCGDPTDGRSRCDFCRQRHNASATRSQRAARARAVALGLCGDCRRAPAAAGRAACQPCLDQTATRVAKRK